jgi:signal transduction histidine kinase
MSKPTPVRTGAETAEGQTLRPRARLLRALGDELISSETVALIELVKNAYDADASGVLVRFVGPLEAGEGSIDVVDNGHGMSLDTIRSTWMEPGTLYRKRAPRSEGLGRRVLGEKGIGRFAASRLAEQLEVVTRRRGSTDEVHVVFDWSQFDDESRYLDEIEARWWKSGPTDMTLGGALGELAQALEEPTAENGTLLRMAPLRTAWTEEKVREVRSTLARLVLPSADGIAVESDFRIMLELPDPLTVFSGLVEAPETLGQPHYSVAGSVAEDATYKLEMSVRGLREPIRLEGRFHLPDDREPQCGPFGIELRVWDRDAASLEDLAGAHGASLRNVRRDLNEAAGVSIYRDGFRVLPYGEPRNDWLRLDLRRVQLPTKRLSNNQIVGFITISADRNPGLRDQTNREGLIEARAFEDLRDFVEQVLSELETARYVVRHPERPSRGRAGVFAGFDLKDIQGLVRERHPTDSDLLAAVEIKQEDLDRRILEVQEVIARYRRLATLGQLIDSVLHNGRTPLSKIRNEADLVLPSLDEALTPARMAQLRKRLELISNQAGVLAAVFRRIEPFGGRKRGRPRTIVLETLIAEAFAVLGPEIERAGVKLDLPESKTELTADPTELQEILINLIENSLHWLGSVPKGRREIAVDVRRLDDRVEFEFSDSGPGVDPRYRERIFEPYFSSKPDGIGLGLAIAGEIVQEYYGGELELLSSGRLPGATFRATLRKRI